MNLFVTKLDYEIREDELRSLFENYGAVDSAKIIIDRETGRSKGFGFVEMSNDEEAQAAIDDLDGSEVNGREIIVKKARPREEGGGGGGFRRDNNRGGGGGGRDFNNDRRF